MQRIFFSALFFVAVQGFSQSKNELAIREILDQQAQAWNLGNIDGFMNGYWKNDSLTFIGKSGITYGWVNTLNNYKKHYPDTTIMGKLDFNTIMVKRLSSKYYQVLGKWHLQRSTGDVSGQYTLLFKKIKRHWWIISDHSS
jgi:hypothetical protein